MKKVYNCYSRRLCHYLIENGEIPITTAYRTDTGLHYHIFKMTESLDNLLTAWSNK
ncbi:MAG: hypothetical protein GX947_02495 [Tissierellia bacterium]|nr:hypothetical protein [Tissierellia bacterium]